MTKEELEKEAEEYADWFWGASPSMMKALAEAYIKGAEPREKRIAELEKENVELKARICKVAQNILDNWCKGDDPCPHLKKRDEQLTKAKEIIRSLYFIIQGKIDYKGNIPLEDEMYRANQFLNSEVEK